MEIFGIVHKKSKRGWALPLLTFFAFFLTSCLGDKGTEAGDPHSNDKISLTGQIVDRENAPISGVVVELAKTGISDTTDAYGKYSVHQAFIPNGLGKLSANAVLDTLLFKQHDQQFAALEVTHWVDTFPDLKVVQRDISGLLLAGKVQIATIRGELSGDGISKNQPLSAQFFYNQFSNNYSGFVYFHVADTTQNYAVTVNTYDAQSRFIGRSRTIPFSSLAGNITVPPFNPNNAIPTAYAGKDTVVTTNNMLALHGVAVDSFGGTISKWEWDIGGAGVFKTTSTADTTFLISSSSSGIISCVLRVTDNDGNTSANDTLTVITTPGGSLLAARYFKDSVQTIFENRCVGCHAKGSFGWAQTGSDSIGLDLKNAYASLVYKNSYEYQFTTSVQRLRVKPGFPDSSYLFSKVSVQTPPYGGRMPLGGAQLPDTEINIIKKWILNGAPLGDTATH